MQLCGPHTYQIAWGSSKETPKVVKSANGKPQFSNPVTCKSKPKLYVVSHHCRPIYVGTTTDSITKRLNGGFKANPKTSHGYRGYLWKNLREAAIHIWMLTPEGPDFDSMNADPSMTRWEGNCQQRENIVVETVEAEVVLLIHQEYLQWPEYQTEIHFHQSQDPHKKAARDIIKQYKESSCPTA